MTHEPDTALWPAEDYRLLVRISSTGLYACLRPKTEGERLQIADVHWQHEHNQSLRRIEDAVYEEHLPIDVYETEIILEPQRILVAPTASLYDEEVAEDMYALMYPTSDNNPDDVQTEQCDDVTFIYGLPRGLQGFIERTFCAANVHTSLSERYSILSREQKNRSGQHTHVYVRPGRMDVIAFSGGNLQLANSYAYTEPADAAYYILNAWQTCGLSQLQGHLHLHPEENADPIPLRDFLTQYISHIDIS